MLQFEKNIQDDYIKFLRFSHSKIDNSAGVIGLVTNHGYIDGITLRGDRSSLLSGSDIVRVLDLHGNSNKNESYYSGNADGNVFEIKQGVAILMLVRGGRQTAFGFGDVWGSSEDKEKILSGETMTSLTTGSPSPTPEKYDFRPIQSDRQHAEWNNWIALDAVFPLFSTGVETGFDEILQSFDRQELLEQLRYFDDTSTDQLIEELEIVKGHSLALAKAKPNLISHEAKIGLLQKAPFDFRPTLLHKPLLKTNSFKVMANISSQAPALVATRQTKEHFCGFAIGSPCGHKLTSGYDRVSVFPLYVLPNGTETRTLPNIAPAFANRVALVTGLTYDDRIDGPEQGAVSDKTAPKSQQTARLASSGDPSHSFEPRELFDWTHAVLHSPTYRSRYADYLKSDFAHVPLPGSRALFEALIPLGRRLVALHLLDANTAPDLTDPKPVRFVGTGEARVAAKMPEFKAGRVYVNASCWFQDVPERAWSFHVGGYQPAQKWLKDRAAKGGKKASDGRVLDAEDVLHYRRLIAALDATIDLMDQIDTVIEKHGGWPDAFRGMAGG